MPVKIRIIAVAYLLLELKRKMTKLFANSGDPDQTLHSAASDMCLHCLPITLLRVSRLQWVNNVYAIFFFWFSLLEYGMLLELLLFVEQFKLELVFVKHYAPNCLTLTLLDSNTACPWRYSSIPIYLPGFKALASIAFEIFCWQDFIYIFSKGHNSGKGHNPDGKKIQVSYFFMRNPYMKFQNPSRHSSKLMLCVKKCAT